MVVSKQYPAHQNYDRTIMQIFLKVIRWTGFFSIPVFLLTVPNAAAARNIGIGSCAESLISSGVGKSAATTACSDAIAPKGLAACVAEIEAETDVDGNAALQSCYRVRRPEALASCVITISGALEPDRSSMMALDSCRQSLLPERHAECTLDLVNVEQVEVEEAMESCIAAQITSGSVAPEVE